MSRRSPRYQARGGGAAVNVGAPPLSPPIGGAGAIALREAPSLKGAAPLSPARVASIGPASALASEDAWAALPFVPHGYRVNHSVVDAALSIFTLHNETLNIASHLIGFLYFVALTPHVYAALRAIDAPARDYALFGQFFVCTLFQLGTSALYHTFRSVSPRYEALFLELDIAGILVMILGSAIMGFAQGYECFPLYGAAHSALLGLLLVAALCLSRLAAGNTAWAGATLFSLFFAIAWSVVPCAHMVLLCSTDACRRILSEALVAVFLWYLGGFVFFYLRLPERLAPHALASYASYVGTSHQIWHVCVLAAGRTWLLGCLEFNRMKSEAGADWCAAADAAAAGAGA